MRMCNTCDKWENCEYFEEGERCAFKGKEKESSDNYDYDEYSKEENTNNTLKKYGIRGY